MGCKHSVPTSDLSELPPVRKSLGSSQASTIVEKVPSRLGATLFKNATIISYNDKTESLQVLRNASMLIEDGRIAQIFETDLFKIPSHAEIVDATGKIISPGFVNTHHHMWQTQLRTIAADTTLQEYFARYGQTGPASKTFTPEDVYLGQTVAALEMIDSGTTTVLDHAHGNFSDEHVDAALIATFESGLRVFHAHAVEQVPVYTFEQSLTKFKSLLNDRRFSQGTVKLGLAYDMFAFMPTEVNQQVMRLVTDHNNTSDSPISLLTSHFVAGPYGCNNTPSHLESMSVLSQPELKQKLPVVLSHASFLDDKDATLIRKHPHVTISSTPESEAHFGHTSKGADSCQDCASLGVDTHFTFNAYMPFQARLWLQQLRLKEYTKTLVNDGNMPATNPMSVEDAFLLMTKKGGDALGRNDLGVIKVGAQADLVIFDCQRPSLWACRDPVAAVVLHTGGAGDVEGVMVAGNWLKRDYRVLRDVTSVKRRFEDSASRIQRAWAAIERPVFKEGESTFLGSAKFAKCRDVKIRREKI